jgi:putative restriction endonuclease
LRSASSCAWCHRLIWSGTSCLDAVGLELGTPVTTRRRDIAFRAAVVEAYLAECCVCGFSLRLMDGLIGVDAAHIPWDAHAGLDEVPNGLALCALQHRLFDFKAITLREDLRVRALAGSSPSTPSKR